MTALCGYPSQSRYFPNGGDTRPSAFLAELGLTLSDAKTRIVTRQEGFNFLGFQIRWYKRKLLTRPQKQKVLKHLRSIKSYLNTHQQVTAGQLIRDLNPVIRGWANYYRHSAPKRTFSKVQHPQWHMIWLWARRRHPNRPTRWVKRRYYKEMGIFWAVPLPAGAHTVTFDYSPPLVYAGAAICILALLSVTLLLVRDPLRILMQRRSVPPTRL